MELIECQTYGNFHMYIFKLRKGVYKIVAYHGNPINIVHLFQTFKSRKQINRHLANYYDLTRVVCY